MKTLFFPSKRSDIVLQILLLIIGLIPMLMDVLTDGVERGLYYEALTWGLVLLVFPIFAIYRTIHLFRKFFVFNIGVLIIAFFGILYIVASWMHALYRIGYSLKVIISHLDMWAFWEECGIGWGIITLPLVILYGILRIREWRDLRQRDNHA